MLGVLLLALTPGARSGPPDQGARRPSHADTTDDAARWSEAAKPITDQALATGIPAWCGTVRSSDDTANEVDNGTPKWHLVIAVPSDVARDPLLNVQGLHDRGMFNIKAMDLFHTSRVGLGANGGTGTPKAWKLRFDYGTNCGPEFPDISYKVLPRTQAQYTNDPWTLLIPDLQNAGYTASNKRYLVHYVGQSMWCGQAVIISSTNAGGGHHAITYNISKLGNPLGICDWTTDSHEIGHSLGAATGGPQNNDGAHVWDCWNDNMSYQNDATKSCGDRVLYWDWNHDNYYGHSGSWNDTDVSAYWCKPICKPPTLA